MKKVTWRLFRSRWMYLVLLTSAIIFITIFFKLFLTITARGSSWPVIFRWQQLTQNTLNPILREEKIEKEFYWKHHGANRMMSTFDCRPLLEGNFSEQMKAIQYSKNHPKKLVSNPMFIDLVSNCTEFKTRRGYFTEPVSKEEADYPIAFSILFYKDIQQVERLLRAIYRPQNVYCLHMDAYSSDLLLLAAKALVKCFHNVFLASTLEKIVYAGYSRLKADINCMRDVLQKHKSWKYYINLASQDFPLKTNLEIVKILKIYNGSNDIEGMDGPRLLRGRFYNKFLLATKKPRSRPYIYKTNISNSRPPHGLKIVRGSAYGIFSRQFVDFIINNKMSQDLLQWSKDTYSPDEHFWATLNHLKDNPSLKTPGGYAGEPNRKPWNAVYAAWGRRDVDPCFSFQFVRGVCIFGLADLPQLISRKELFANKFHFNFQYIAQDCLEEWLYNRTVNPPVFDSFYYRRLPFINSRILEQPTRKPAVKLKQAPKKN